MSPAEQSQSRCQRPSGQTQNTSSCFPSLYFLPSSPLSTTCPEQTLKNRKQIVALPYHTPLMLCIGLRINTDSGL